MEKNRIEAFSDGIIAIIITIMVLELKQPVGDHLSDLFKLGHVLLSYVISYFFIAIYWVNHHLIFHQAKRINVKILWCNILWLFVMSFIPFATAWIGSYPQSWAPLTIYFADLALACITFHLMYYLIACENGHELFKMGPKNIASLIIYTGAAFIGGSYPMVAYFLVTAVSAWWIVPTKRKG